MEEITVRELIDKLNQVENKDLPILLGQHYVNGDGGSNCLYDLVEKDNVVYIEFC